MTVGHIVHGLGDPGVVVVREFGDTSMAADKNPPVLFDLLKREDATCQTCSNREVSTSSEDFAVTSRCYPSYGVFRSPRMDARKASAWHLVVATGVTIHDHAQAHLSRPLLRLLMHL